MSDEADPQLSNANVLDYFNAKQTGSPRRWQCVLVWPIALFEGTMLFLALLPSLNRTHCATRSTERQSEERAAEIEQVTLSQSEVDH